MTEKLDMLIVGGGPAGTAAAFRAEELGVEALVVEYDDLMKRIRDYSKEKLILPSFGGGARMRFPAGGELVSKLPFPPIDKDEICAAWKALYRQGGVRARVGVELTGLSRLPDGSYRAKLWDHGERREDAVEARFVVLALGRGVPRHFDVPGDTEGIAYRLEDPAFYVGGPACVIGGGTSAAEAVIAISKAKAAAGDATEVHWSYRGDRLPRVSKALAEIFFEAYVGNGNIRYHPRSEPAAVVTAEDRREYLAVRIDRRRIEGRPCETSLLEFPKESCVACIGEDLPEALLASVGIRMVHGGPKGKKRIAVTPYLESELPNVFLAGDLLSQVHLVAEDLSADPATFEEVVHRGNIKASLRDGVLVAEVVRCRLDGRPDSEVRIEDSAEAEPAASVAGLTGGAVSDSPPAESVAPGREQDVAEAEAVLVRSLPGDEEAEELPLEARGVTTLGQSGCDLSFPQDDLLSERHASISHTEDGYFLRDDGSTSGVFLRIQAADKVEVGDGDVVRAGRHFLLFARSGGAISFTHYDHTGKKIGVHEIPEHAMILGRQAPDLTLDPADKTLSRRHLAVSALGEKAVVKDLGSVNGTFLRVRNAVKIGHGSQLRAGRQRLTLRLRSQTLLKPGAPAGPSELVAPTSAPAAAVQPSTEPAAASAAAGGASVLFRTSTGEPAGPACPLRPGQTLCEAAEEAGLPLNAECHAGICGSDPIRILSGREHLDAEPGDQEAETLEDLCNLKPGEHRLACMVRARGPVEVEIL